MSCLVCAYVCMYVIAQAKNIDQILANLCGQEQKSAKMGVNNNLVIVAHQDHGFKSNML